MHHDPYASPHPDPFRGGQHPAPRYPYPYPPAPIRPVMHPQAFAHVRSLFWWTVSLISATVLLTTLLVLAPEPLTWMLLAAAASAAGLGMTVVAIVMFSSGAGSGCPSPWRGMVIGTFVGALLTATLTISVATYDVLSDVGRLLGGA